MRFLLFILIFTVVILFGLICLTQWIESDTVTVRYDCRQLIGGWHPDMPSAVQEQCRSRRNDAGSKTRN